MKQILNVNNIQKSFGSNKVLDDVSFEMHEGECLCLLGSSGSGKSTLLQIIAGLMEPDSGSLHIENHTIYNNKKNVPPEKRPLNMIFQNYALWPHMTAKENIEYGLKISKYKAADRKKMIASVVKLLQIDGLLHRSPAELSGGQQQRIGIARGLVNEPQILLMDEPLSNLDVKLRMEMRRELSILLKKFNVSTIYVTHDMLEAFTLADRILVLSNGKVAQLDTPQKMFEEPKTIGVAELMGYQNKIYGEISKRHDEKVNVSFGDENIQGVAIHKSTDNEHVRVMFQIDAVEIVSDNHLGDGDTVNILHAKISHAIYEGMRWKYSLELSDGQWIEAYSKNEIAEGKVVKLSIKADGMRVFFEA